MKITTRCGDDAVAGLNEALLAKAATAKLLRADRVRADTTVVEADVAYPTDSGLLAKAIGTMARTVERIKCVKPTDCGLVVAPRIRLTWSVPVRVPAAVDPFGNVTRWIDVDREIAGHWDDRVWRDYP